MWLKIIRLAIGGPILLFGGLCIVISSYVMDPDDFRYMMREARRA